MTHQALGAIDAALAAAGRTRAGFEIIITPASADADAVREFRDMGVDRLVPILAASSPEAVDGRFRQLGEFANIVA